MNCCFPSTCGVICTNCCIPQPYCCCVKCCCKPCKPCPPCNPCCPPCPRPPVQLEPLTLLTGVPDTQDKEKKVTPKETKKTTDKTTSKSSIDLSNKAVGEGDTEAGGTDKEGSGVGKGGKGKGKKGKGKKKGKKGKGKGKNKGAGEGKDGVGAEGEGKDEGGGFGADGCRCCRRCPCNVNRPSLAPRLQGPCACCNDCPCHKFINQRPVPQKPKKPPPPPAKIYKKTKTCDCSNAQNDLGKATLVLCEGCGHRKKVYVSKLDEDSSQDLYCCNKTDTCNVSCCVCGKMKKNQPPTDLTVKEAVCNTCGRSKKSSFVSSTGSNFLCSY